MWRYHSPPKERLEAIAISPDGRSVFCDYTTEPLLVKPGRYADAAERKPGGDIYPLDTVGYSGGIYCFGSTGKVRWKTRRKATSVLEDVEPPLGSVGQATRGLLLLVNPGWECERGLTLLNFSGRILLRREFAQGKAQSIVLWPDGRRLAIGWHENLTIMDLAGKTLVGVKGLSFRQWSESAARAVSPDGKVLLAYDSDVTRLAFLDKAGRLKWSYKFPADWSPYVVPSTGASAGQRVSVIHEPAVGAGPQGTSVLVVRGTRRVLFRFRGSSYIPKQVELPGVDQLPGYEYLSPDGTVIAVVARMASRETSGKRRQPVTLLSASGAVLGEVDLPRLPSPGQPTGFSQVAFSNPAKYLAMASGPDLYFMGITP
jgi:hypothetical protein